MTTTHPGEITMMIRQIREGDRDQAVSLLVKSYFDRLAVLASPILRSRSAGRDGEDAALSALNVLYNGLAEGKFEWVQGREMLWRTLVTITERKALQYIRRFEPTVRFEDGMTVIDATSEYETTIRLTVKELIEGLENPLWRQAALLHLQGYTVPEIAKSLGRSRECIYKWFRAIEKVWQAKAGGEWPID